MIFFLALKDLAVCMKTKIFFLKTEHFNTGFVYLRYKNTNRY
jgi:hypothetical protein